ncbi:MAG: LuxR C-terminal-related transcriptional regulator [Acidimicrobiales bacterium]
MLERLPQLIGFDGAFFATTDPATLLYTSAVRRDMPAEASAAFIRTEFGEDDVNQLRVLARGKGPVGWLDAATCQNRSASLRYREAMQPFGLGDELRVALLLDGYCWGLLCLHRGQSGSGFDQRDADLLGALAPYLAAGLRRSMVSDRASVDWTDDGPGVAMVNSDRTLEAVTPAAARWLAELAALELPKTRGLPTVVRAVIERLETGVPSSAPTLIPRARVRTLSGRWLVVHASHLDNEEGRIAVIIEPATPAALSPLVVAAYGLTLREAEVAQRLVAGLARKSIAAQLTISVHTVNDHVKAIFDKSGVSSAGQLRARLFSEGDGARPTGSPRT